MNTYKRTLVTVAVMVLMMLTSLNIPSVMAEGKEPGNITPAQVGSRAISGAPLTVRVLDNLAMAVDYEGRRQFYSDTAGGSFVEVDGVVYGSTPPAGGSFRPLPFTPVSNSAVSGTGTAADPFLITTEVDAGATGVRITQVTTYVNGEQQYRVDLTARNTSEAARNVRIFHGADLYLNFPGNVPDTGFGLFDAATGAVGALSQDLRSVQVFIPITPVTAFQEAIYNTFWLRIGNTGGAAGPGFNNTINPNFHDVAAGLQYDRALAAGASATVSFAGGFGLAADVGITLPGVVDDEPQPEPAQLWVVTRPNFNASVAPGAILAYEFVVGNVGRGDSTRADIVFPFDPNLVQVLDASFDVPSTWVMAVNSDSLVIRTAGLGSRNGRTTGTIRFRVNQQIQPGTVITGRTQLTWLDRRSGGRALGNLFAVTVGTESISSPTYRLNSSASAGAVGSSFVFSSDILVPTEPVGIWYNRPDGQVVAVGTQRATVDGTLAVNFNADLPPGVYSMVFYGLWSEMTTAVPFTITP